VDGLERVIEVTGAYDKRHPDPKKNYGIHGMNLRFLLKGPLGTVQFVVFTAMHLPHVTRELWRKNAGSEYNPFEPQGADIGYHSPKPRYEHQSAMDCELAGGEKCYYDGSSLQADEFMPTFLSGGADVVWPMLEERYRDLFERGE
jgi:hypothetical protein